MRSTAVTTVSLDRQKAVIESLNARIDEREARGELVELSLSLLAEEKRLYLGMLHQAPLHVLQSHTPHSCFT